MKIPCLRFVTLSLRANKTREKIELSVWCENLANQDTFSKSDPFVQFYTRSNSKSAWSSIGQTEVNYKWVRELQRIRREAEILLLAGGDEQS